MKKIILEENPNKIYFIGIGGVSMSGLAMLMYNSGYIISGSDRSRSSTTSQLEKMGIKINYEHNKDNITDDISLVVYTAAIKEDNEEFIECKRKGIKTIDRSHFLGQIMKNFQTPISIAGIHGKTTTTSLISEIFLQANTDPTISVGAYYETIKGNLRIGNSQYFIVESCEYCDSFLQFFPHIGIILNIEADHLDYFKDLKHIENSFKRFSHNIDNDGILIINESIPNLQYITEDLKCNVITYGQNTSTWFADNISYDQQACPTFDLLYKGEFLTKIKLSIHGNYNVENALAAIACAYACGLSITDIQIGIAKFKGASRRFEHKGYLNGLHIVDDYAHHPTAVKVNLAAVKNGLYNKIYCVFQPHTFTRTIALFNEFVEAFDDADEIILLDIYSAREIDTGEVSSKDLADAICKRGKNAKYFESFEKARDYLLQKDFNNDLLITMGAGDVYLLAEQMLCTDLSTISTISTVS